MAEQARRLHQEIKVFAHVSEREIMFIVPEKGMMDL